MLNSPVAKRPHLILIMTDQQRFDTIAGMGYPHMHTPHLDALSKRSVRFRQAYCPGATCVASRAAIFTGMYAHNTGAYTFTDWAHHSTWVQDLAEAGYHCANIGKMHFQPRDVAGGFHERIIVENPTSISYWGGTGEDAWGRHLAAQGLERPNHRHRCDPAWREKFQGVPWHLDPSLHSDIFIGDKAVEWINHYCDDHPVFLQVGFTGPHEPWDPLPQHLESYEGVPLPSPATFDDNLARKPPQQSETRTLHATCDHESRIDMPHACLEDVARMRRHYYAKITLVDEQIGRVVEALEQKGMLTNSLLVFCSDHGEMLGEHRSAYKWLMYDDVVHVPCLAVWGGRTGEVEELVSLIDLGPTFLEAAGVPIPGRLEGQSLMGYLRDGPPPLPRQRVYCEDNYQIMNRSRDEKIVLYLGQEEGEYYDLAADPGEMNNLWDHPDARCRRETLQRETLESVALSVYQNAGYRNRTSNFRMRTSGPPGQNSLHGAVPTHCISSRPML